MSTLHVNASISVEIIPLQELAKHNTKTDAWISIRGRVYDISWYISQHPGGVDPLLAYIGKDGTKAFNSIHSYVDFASILKGHEKGILEGHSLRTKEATAATSFSELVLEDDPPPTKTCCGCIHRRDRRMPKISFFNSPAAIAYEVKFKRNPLVPPSQEEDWCVGLDEEDNVFTVKKYLDDTNIWMASYKIDNPISYAFIQCVFRDSYDTCEITMKKKEEGVVWRRLGTPMPRSHVIIPNSSLNDSYDASIVYKEKVARDVNIYGIRFRRCVHFGIRLGHHMKIQLEDVTRAYTPVCYSMSGKPAPSKIHGGHGQIFWFIIKTYKNGPMTQKLDQVHVSKDAKFVPNVKVSSPLGSFDATFLLYPSAALALIMFAGGTGITPMVRIIAHVVEQYHNGGLSDGVDVVLIFWNKTMEDIIWNDQFTDLSQSESDWFRFIPVLTQPAQSWKGLVGRPSMMQINAILDDYLPDRDVVTEKHALICGSNGFIKSVEDAISGEFPKNFLHAFEG